MKKLLLFLLMFIPTLASAQKGTEMNLWPEGPRTSNDDPNDMAKVTVFLPDAKKATGRAVVCCPGGGYTHLAWEKEGTSWAPFFNGQGIALIVLKYRMPRCFLALAHDDRAVPPLNSLNYYEQLYTHGVPATMHVYPTGGHGFGILQSFAYHIEMMLELKAWLHSF